MVEFKLAARVNLITKCGQQIEGKVLWYKDKNRHQQIKSLKLKKLEYRKTILCKIKLISLFLLR